LDDDIGDEKLRLIFTACHPRLSRAARAAPGAPDDLRPDNQGDRQGLSAAPFCADRLPNRACLGSGTGSPDRAGVEGTNALLERMTMLFVFFALAGCTSVVAGPAQAPNAPYQQGDPRDTSGMH
jgi:hypothetical protein